MTKRINRMLGAISQLLNVLLLSGHPNESISGRAYRNGANGHERWERARRVIDTIFFWQLRHCRSAYEGDLAWARDYLATKPGTGDATLDR